MKDFRQTLEKSKERMPKKRKGLTDSTEALKKKGLIMNDPQNPKGSLQKKLML